MMIMMMMHDMLHDLKCGNANYVDQFDSHVRDSPNAQYEETDDLVKRYPTGPNKKAAKFY